MKFIGLFAVSCLSLLIAVTVFGNLWGGSGLLILIPLFVAIVLRMYLSIDERLEEIERRLGIIDEEEKKTFTEQLKEEE